MTPDQLQAELEKAQRRIDSASAALDKINNSRDYSDEVAEHFHLGMVGFRKDTKRTAQTLNRAIDNGVKASGLYDDRSAAQAKIKAIQGDIDYIQKYATAEELETATRRSIEERRKKSAIEAAPVLQWEKVKGNYGPAYRYGGYVVERVEPGFVAVRNSSGKLFTHCKTVKEAKSIVSIYITKQAQTA